ncbi:hypothetical protein Aeqsu_2555 [Aequorivita sublithincola DSM 14238]|uniref:KWG repeat protein n=2 Tax=Aequorivita TaxID=153265 RepID=I3YYE3_AEQSU|nr:hypothetical protein Aeqsu_2555 [Aequorivita sublithincola DSM 14238]
MRYLIFLLFFPSIVISQSTKEYTKEIKGSGYANDGFYNYEAKIKYQLWNQGMGDIVLKIGIMDYKITRFREKDMVEINTYDSPVANQFPLVLKNHQGDVRFDLFIKWNGGNGTTVVRFTNLKEEAVRQGALDLYYFDKEQVKEMVEKFELKKNRDNIEDLDVEMNSIYIDNNYFGDLSSITNQYYKSKKNENSEDKLENKKTYNNHVDNERKIVEASLKGAEARYKREQEFARIDEARKARELKPSDMYWVDSPEKRTALAKEQNAAGIQNVQNSVQNLANTMEAAFKENGKRRAAKKQAERENQWKIEYEEGMANAHQVALDKVAADEKKELDESIKIGVAKELDKIMIILTEKYEKQKGNSCTDNKEIIPVSLTDDDFNSSFDEIKNMFKNKYGFINSEHKIKIPFIYDYADCFKNGLAYVRRNDLVGYINSSGQEVIPIKYLVASSLGKDGYWVRSKSEGNFHLGLDGKIIRKLKDVIYSGEEFYIDKKLIKFRKDEIDYYGVMDIKGNVILPSEYEEIEFVGEDYKDVKFISTTINNKTGLCNLQGQLIIPHEYDELVEIRSEYIRFKKGEELIDFDHNGKIKTIAYDWVEENTEKKIKKNYLLSFEKDNLFGLMRAKDSVEIVSPIYSQIDPIYTNSNKYYRVLLRKKIPNSEWLSRDYGLIDNNGKLVLPCEYGDINGGDHNSAIFRVLENGKLGILNNNFDVIIPSEYEQIRECLKKTSKNTYKPTGYIGRNGDNYTILNLSGEKLIDRSFLHVSGFYDYDMRYHIFNDTSGNYGILDEDFNFYLDNIKTELGSYFYGYYSFKSNNGKWGTKSILDHSIIIQPTYDEFWGMTDYIIEAVKDGKFGLLDRNGKTLLPFKYNKRFKAVEEYHSQNRFEKDFPNAPLPYDSRF